MSKLISLLEQQVSESDTTDSLVGQQRERNHRYYAMQPLGNEVKGRSHYIDPAVFSSVEDKKSIFDETFLSSRQVVRFNCANHAESEAKTAYVQRVLKANKYTRLFKDGWHNTLVAKRMTVWADWRRDREEITLSYLGAPTEVVNAQVQQLGDVVDINSDGLESREVPSMGPPRYLHTGTLVVTVDKSFLALDLIKPENVFRDPCQSYAEDASWNTARFDMTRIELINRGYDEEVVRRLKADSRNKNRNEDTARKSGESYGSSVSQMDGDLEEVTLYKTRTWLTPKQLLNQVQGFEPEPGPAIYEIHWCGTEVLYWDDGTPAVTVLDEMHVHEWGEFKIAHAADAMCTADVEAHQQKATSGLKRGVMDNMNITNNPMWEANPSGLKDMSDLYDGVIGGVVETEDGFPVGQIKAMEMPQLSPIVMGVLQMLDRDGEERSGMSNASRGLNQDVLSQQNAENMVDKVSARGERRVAMAVRSFANDFLVPLLQTIVKIASRHDKSQTVTESGGRQVVIAPSQWQDKENEMEVEVALTPQEAKQMASTLMMMDSKLKEDPDMRLLYGIKQKHTLYDTVFELMGVKDSTKFMGSPESPEVQQQAQQVAMQAKQAQMKQDQMIMANMQFQADSSARAWAELNNKIMDTEFDNRLDRDEFNADTYFRRAEMAMEKEQQRAVSIQG